MTHVYSLPFTQRVREPIILCVEHDSLLNVCLRFHAFINIQVSKFHAICNNYPIVHNVDVQVSTVPV